MNDTTGDEGRSLLGHDRKSFVRDLAIGVGTVAFIIWITFFGTEGIVEIATLAVAVALLIWFASVEPQRLMEGPRRPDPMLFLLAGVGLALVLTSALLLKTGTLFLILFLTIVAVGVGLVRALAFSYRQKPEG